MKLSQIIQDKHIVIDFEAKNKQEAVGALIIPALNGYDRDTLLMALMEREKLGSTGVGNGVAVPHVRLDIAEKPTVVFGRSARPIDFDAIDDQPCRLFFLIIGPTSADAQNSYLQTMAKISRLMRDAGVRAALLSAATASEVMKVIVAAEG